MTGANNLLIICIFTKKSNNNLPHVIVCRAHNTKPHLPSPPRDVAVYSLCAYTTLFSPVHPVILSIITPHHQPSMQSVTSHT